MSVAVFALVMNGSSLIEKVLSLWSFVLYGVYILFLILVFANFSGQIGHNIASVPVTGNWTIGGFQYSFYNLAIIIAVLYTIKHSDTPKDAAIARCSFRLYWYFARDHSLYRNVWILSYDYRAGAAG